MRAFAATLALLFISAAQALAFDVNVIHTQRGVEVWHVEDHSVPLIALEFAFAQGSATDADGKEGAASLMASLLDEGAGGWTGREFRKLRDDNAIVLSFQPSVDRFYGTFNTPSAEKAIGFKLLHAAINDPAFPDEAVERKRQATLVGVEAEAQDPSSVAFRAAGALALPGHPYLRPASGDVASVRSLTRADLVASRKAIFARKNLKIVIVGDITAEEAGREVDALFGTLPEESASPAIPQGIVSPGPHQKVISWDMPQSTIMFGGPGLAYDDPDYMAAQVLFEIVGGDKSLLTQELREKRGLTYGVSYSLMTYDHAGLTFGSFSTGNATAGEALTVVKDVLRRLRDNGPTAAEVEAAKSNMMAGYVFRYESLRATAGTLLGNAILGLGPDYHKTRNEKVAAVTLAQVNAMAKRLIDPDRLFVVAIGKPVGL